MILLNLTSNPPLLPHERAFVLANLAEHAGLSCSQVEERAVPPFAPTVLYLCDPAPPREHLGHPFPWQGQPEIAGLATYHPRMVFTYPTLLPEFAFHVSKLGAYVHRAFIQYAASIFTHQQPWSVFADEKPWEQVLDPYLGPELTAEQRSKAQGKFAIRVCAMVQGKPANIDEDPQQLQLVGL